MAKTVTLESTIKKVTVASPNIAQPLKYVQFDTTAGEPASPQQGQIWWDAPEQTWSGKQDGAVLQFGQEVQWPVVNKTGSQIDNGTVVMAVGTTGATGRINVAPMDGTDPANAKFILGVATHDIGNNEEGKVTAFGKVRDLDTTAWNEGDVLWVDASSADGQLTNVEPASNALGMPIAFVVTDNANQGVISVRITPIDEHLVLSANIRDALTGADSPSASNVFATISDLPYTNVKEYGATGDGSTDDSTAIQSAIDAIEAVGCGVLYFPVGDYKIGTGLTITEPVSMVGEGFKSNLFASADIQMFTVNVGTVKNRENNNPGFVIHNMRFTGISPTEEANTSIPWNRANLPSASCFKFLNTDHVLIDQCFIKHFKYEALWYDTKNREHRIQNCTIRYCGDLAAGRPMIKIYESSSSADAHNNLFFSNNSILYTLGDCVKIDGNPANGTFPRNIHFVNNLIHGLVSPIDGMPYSHTGLTAFRLFDVTDCEGLRLVNNRIITGGDSVPIVHFREPSAANRSRFHSIIGGSLSQHYAITTPGNANAIKIDGAVNAADVAVDGVSMTGHNTVVSADAGAIIRWGTNNIVPGSLNVWGSDSAEWVLYKDFGGPDINVEAVYNFTDRVKSNLVQLSENSTPLTQGGEIRYVANRFQMHDGTAQRDVYLRHAETTGNLDDVNDDINTTVKYPGKMAWNLSTNRPVWAAGSAAGDVWVYADGTTAHTPV